MLFHLFALLLFNLPAAISQSSECGSLITYRQLDELLTTAPSCLRAGCQPDTPQLAMKSSCPRPSPCHAFWNLLRQEWQRDWCDTCSQDIACRIDGWPILNSTSACARSPNEWLFSNAADGCCANDLEPFELAAWTGVLCNGSEWREPFTFYGGMARDDWVEWLQPWNWTVHMKNETDRNFTQVVCDSARAMQVAFAVDNVVSLGWAALELFLHWLCCICAWSVVMNEIKTMRRSLAAGLITGGLYLVSNFATSIMWDLRPGYSHIPRGFVGLLLCARPSILGFLSLISIWGRGKVERSIATNAEELRQQRESSWVNRPHVKEWRRAFGTFLRRFERGDRRNRPVTDEDLADGKETAKQLLAGFALTIGVSELVIQVSSVYSIFKTATVGGSRGFFSRYALLPFYKGEPASRMYGGALLHCVFLFPSTLGLVLIAASHAKEQKYQEWRRYLDINDRRRRKLQNYYNNRPVGRPLTDNERAEARYMYQEQRAFERSLLGRQRPGFWKRTWSRTRRIFTRGEPLIPPATPPPPAERGFFHKIRVKLTLAVTRPLFNWIQDINSVPLPADPEAGDAGTTGAEGGTTNITGNQATRRIRRLAGRALSVPFLRTRITRSFTRANEEEIRRRTERDEQERGPNQERFIELVAIYEENRRREEERRRRRPTRRSPAFIFTLFLVSMNYISQWLFWSGYVEIAGERWCPPDEEFNIEKGIWAALAAVALLVSVILSSSTDSAQAPAA